MSESVSERLTAEELAAERVFWESVKDSANAADFEAYLSHYPQGRFASLARNRLAALLPPDTPPVVPEVTAESVEAGLDLERRDRRLIQLGLAAEGFDPGPADGLFGRGTRGAIGQWQASRGEVSTGYLDAESAKLLLASGTKREADEQARREAEERTRQEATAEAEREKQEAEAHARREEQERARHAAEAEKSIMSRDAAVHTVSKALRIAEGIGADKDRALAFRIIAEMQVKVGNRRDAERSFSRAESAAEQIGDDSIRAETFKELAAAMAGIFDAAELFSKAVSAAELIGDDIQRADILRGIVSARAAAGDFMGEDAEKIVVEILRVAKRMEPFDRVVTLIIAADVRMKNYKRSLAKDNISEALSMAEKIATVPRAALIAIAARVQADAGNVVEARETINRASSLLEGTPRGPVITVIRDSHYEDLILPVLLELHRFQDALLVAERIEGHLKSARAFLWIADAQIDDSQEAGEAISKALEAAEQLEEDGHRAFLFAGISGRQVAVGDLVSAADSVAKALSAAKGVQDDFQRLQALAAVAEAQAQANKLQDAAATLSKAFPIVDRIGDDILTVQALISITEAQMANSAP